MSTATMCHEEKQTSRKLLIDGTFSIKIENRFWHKTIHVTMVNDEVDPKTVMQKLVTDDDALNLAKGKVFIGGRLAAEWFDCDLDERPCVTFKVMAIARGKYTPLEIDESEIDAINFRLR